MEINKAAENEVIVQDCSVEHVIDLSKCINCDNCTMACAARHGVKRFNRQEVKERSLRELLPYTCRQCFERHCVVNCPVDAMRIDVATGIVSVGSQCIGCGLCAKACPYKAIKICNRDKTIRFSTHQNKGNKGILKLFSRSKEKTEADQCAVKCDLCIGYNNFACAYECPTGALKVRVIQRDGSFKVLPTEKQELAIANSEEEKSVGLEKEIKIMGDVEKDLPFCQKNGCVKCSLCCKKCPVGAITMEPFPKFDYSKCVKCYVCQKSCPKKVIHISEGNEKQNSENEENKNEENKNPNKTSTIYKGEEDLRINYTKEQLGTSIQVKLVVDSAMAPEQLRSLIQVLKEELKLKV